MERIISYDELPDFINPEDGNEHAIYLRMEETDLKLYVSLVRHGYRIVRDIRYADASTIYVTGRRQDYKCTTEEEYLTLVHSEIDGKLDDRGFAIPNTYFFDFDALVNHRYRLPFVFKNENQNCGREKFLIATEEDYDNLINACSLLLNKEFISRIAKLNFFGGLKDYDGYLKRNFRIQEYIPTPSQYNTTVRLLTSSSGDLLYGALKYNETEPLDDRTSLLGFLLGDTFKLSTKSIVSNTCSGGKNVLLFDNSYSRFEKELLLSHGIDTYQFHELVQSAKDVHKQFESELGIICGFDFIYDRERDKWFLLEYHDRPMVGDYSRRQGIGYYSREEKVTASGRVRATALVKKLEMKN